MNKKNKPKVGYQKAPVKKKSKKKESAMHKLFVSPKKKKMPMAEKVVKFIIYFALRLAIRPKKWKDPKKNIEIINRTYDRIMSTDFVYIPSSIAFYLIMAFLPILSIISMLYLIPGVSEFLTDIRLDKSTANAKGDAISDVLGSFIPGGKQIFNDIKNAVTGASAGLTTAATITTVSSLFFSTWIAANGFSKLVFTQSHIYGHKFLGGYWMNKLKGMSMVLIFTLFLVVVLAANVAFVSWIASFNFDKNITKLITYIFLIPSTFVGFFIAFMALYKLSPRFKIKLRHVIPGAMITTIPTAGFIVLFGTITSIWSYGSYGVLGAIMFIGMTSLLITYFIFVGITANAAYYKTFVSNKVKEKWTLSKK